MDIQKELLRITSEYLDENLDYLKLSKASEEYKILLNKICGQNLDIENGRNDLEFDNGKALGTYWAALCLDDLIRTRQFIRGINKAIQEKINKQKPLHILYAGTGPFATLILPFILRYSKEEIRYTFLEVNQFSFEILQNVISKLGLKDYNIKILKEDATKYQIDPLNKPDIIVSETMQNALAKEQQVSIFLNLMKQVSYHTIFIPENIELFIGLKKSQSLTKANQVSSFKKVERVFEVSKKSMFLSKGVENMIIKENLFAENQTIIENKDLEDFNEIVLITKIQVYNDVKIGVNESGLTTPIILKDISSQKSDSVIINTQYKISSQPELEYDIMISTNV